MLAFVPQAPVRGRPVNGAAGDRGARGTLVTPRRAGFALRMCRICAMAIQSANMVSPLQHSRLRTVRAAAERLRGLARRQFITRNRRLGAALALLTVGVGVAAVHVSQSWFAPGVMILPILAGALLLWPRALLVLFGVVAATLAYDAS